MYNTNTGNLESVTNNGTTTTFGYTDTAHPDRLTRCGAKNIQYNSAGLPIAYGNKYLDWTNGKLTKYYDEEDPYGFDSSESTEFTYNAFGQRVRKEYSYYPGVDYSGDFPIGKEVNYDYDHSGRLIREISTEDFTESASETVELIFLYDESGMIGFMHSRDGSTPQAYYYHRNLQGDVVAIYDTSGVKVANYTYDAWGNCTASGSMARINPIRYRGYYWDSETNWYYLNSRYYSPEFRRFISPDDTNYLDPETPNGLNLYCYCNNDPVNYADPSGHSVVAVITIIGLTLGVAGGLGYAAYTDYQDDYIVNGSIGWQRYLGYGLIGGAIGAGIGFTISYFGGSAISSYFGGALSSLGNALSSLGGSPALAIASGGTASVANAGILGAMLAAGALILFAKNAKKSQKETSSEHPSWANERMIDPNKSAQQNATEILNSKYGQGAWKTGPKSEFNQIVKWIQRHLRYYRGW